MIDRLIQAAEAWGRNQYGRKVSAIPLGEPCCGADGTTTVDLELEAAGQSLNQPVHCFVTLEPDGTISCFARERE